MAKKEYVYYREQSGWVHNIPVADKYNPWRTREVILEEIAQRGGTVITEKEFHETRMKIAYVRMKEYFDAENIGKIFSWLLSNQNTYSIKAFSQLAGIKLDRTWKKREQQLIEYYGDKYVAWRQEAEKVAEEKERQRAAEQEKKRQEEVQRIEQDYRDGKMITGGEFLALCDEYKVETHIRTRGFCLKRVSEVQNSGTIWTKKGTRYADGFAQALRTLNKILGINKDE